MYRLKTRLFESYDPWVRPIIHAQHRANIHLDFTLLQLLSMNEVSETMTVSGYLNLVWRDEFMHWTAGDEDNITEIRVSMDQIWKPDIFLLNAADQSSWNQWATSSIYNMLNIE